MIMMVLGALAVCTGCGPGVRTRVESAMQGCLAVRNAAFVRGDGERALLIPLPAAVEALARGTAYTFGLTVYQQTADEATTQSELTCALELGSRYKSDDTREWVRTFTGHPNAPVANLAKRLMALQ